MRLRELASTRARFGYRRLRVLLQRQVWAVNCKRIHRLYRLEEPLASAQDAEETAESKPYGDSGGEFAKRVLEHGLRFRDVRRKALDRCRFVVA